MTKLLRTLLTISLCIVVQVSFAQENVEVSDSVQLVQPVNDVEIVVTEPTPEVGKHVMANMDASSMILSLLMVLALIIISALVLKRFNLTQQSTNQLKVVASLSLGAKERVVVVQIGEQQLVLGVCPQQISLLTNLDNPLDVQLGKPLALSGNVLSFLQKHSTSTSTKSDFSSSETTNNK